MIVKNEREQWIGCDLCGEMVELRRRTLANPETVLMMVETMRADHTDCEQFRHDPRRAAAERGFKVRLRMELAKMQPVRRPARSVIAP